MNKDGLIPQRYAKALYKVSLDKGNSAAVYAEMACVAKAFQENPALQKTLANPFVDRADKEKLLLAAAGKDLEGDYEGFVKVILDNNRVEFAQRMALAFMAIYREANAISQVTITTAKPLGTAEMERLRTMVKKAFPERKLEISEKVDPTLIGGFVVDVDNVRMDASLSNELQQLRQTLLSKK